MRCCGVRCEMKQIIKRLGRVGREVRQRAPEHANGRLAESREGRAIGLDDQAGTIDDEDRLDQRVNEIG